VAPAWYVKGSGLIPISQKQKQNKAEQITHAAKKMQNSFCHWLSVLTGQQSYLIAEKVSVPTQRFCLNGPQGA
jgi:hypothetical protein